ncbi:MAG: hypothetical protein WC898_02910 [Candidatus Paceibacterota bacterium]
MIIMLQEKGGKMEIVYKIFFLLLAILIVRWLIKDIVRLKKEADDLLTELELLREKNKSGR